LPITLDYGLQVSTPDAPMRTGYDFGGWYIDDDTFHNAYIFDTMPGGRRAAVRKMESD
jgi:Listeria/Bacterioides repeat